MNKALKNKLDEIRKGFREIGDRWVYDGSIDLSNEKDLKTLEGVIPENATIRGYLNVYGTLVEKLPRGLETVGKLFMEFAVFAVRAVYKGQIFDIHPSQSTNYITVKDSRPEFCWTSEMEFMMFRTRKQRSNRVLAEAEKFIMVDIDTLATKDIDIAKYDTMDISVPLELTVEQLSDLTFNGTWRVDNSFYDKDGNILNTSLWDKWRFSDEEKFKDAISKFHSGRWRADSITDFIRLRYKPGIEYKLIYLPKWAFYHEYLRRLFVSRKLVDSNGNERQYVKIVRKYK